MNAVDVGAWNADWAWSLPLIVLNVVIHVIGLGLINESVVRVLSGGMERRRFLGQVRSGHGRLSTPYPTPSLRCFIRSAQ